LHPSSPLERETALWEMLSKAEASHSEGHVTLPMPALERAQTRLTEVIQHLNNQSTNLTS